MKDPQEIKCLLRFRDDSKCITPSGNDKETSNNEECRRNKFQIDRDRILYSKAFRRLMHKTQVSFIGEMNEHIRTRLTHTLEVVQISRTIARCVGANEDLTEAIALGHDVGHTPFGHVGEFFLFDLLNMRDVDKLNPDKKILNNFKIKPSTLNLGFKHNYQSVRVLMELEGGYKFNDGKGLSICYPILEGIIKHSSIYYPKGSNQLIQYKDIIDITHRNHFYLDQSFSASLEGQIVNLADEIAQKSHDIEDAIEGNYDTKLELIQYLEDHIPTIPDEIKLKLYKYRYIKSNNSDTILEFIQYLEDHIPAIPEEIKQNLKENIFIKPINSDKIELLIKNEINDYIKGFIGVLIGHLVESSVKIIKEKINVYSQKRGITESDDPYPILEDIATESILAENKVYQLLDFIQKIFIINCHKADREEEKARYILRQIVKAYLNNPKQLRDFVIKRYNPILFEKIDGKFQTEDMEKITEDFEESEDNPTFFIPEKDFNIRFASSKTIKENRDIIINDPVFIRLLCDYIASMTDLFAFEEYKRLYLEKPV